MMCFDRAYKNVLYLLRDMIDKLIEIGRCYGMDMNVGKTKVMSISREPSAVKIMLD
jgi:hypothetical protein